MVEGGQAPDVLGRTCNECGVYKPASEFSLRSDKRGLRSYCKECRRLARHNGAAKNIETALCAICGYGPGGLVVDHDHNCCPGSNSCGLCFRGYLCQNCNRGLGMFADDPARLFEAIRYLYLNSPWEVPE